MDRNSTGAQRPAASPAPLRPIPEAIPAALRAVERWICWRARPRAGGKFDKVPHSPHTGRRCDAHDPANWGSFDQARAALGRHRLDGLGIVLTGEDALVGVDLDGCLNDAGAITSWAREIVVVLDSYTERSPSGRGLRLLAVGTLPPGRRAADGVELYDRARFLTITGHHLAGTPVTIERRDEALREVHARHLAEEMVPPPPATPAEPTAVRGDPPPLDELRAMLRCIPSRLTYEAWLHVLMAVHEAYPGPEGVALCEAWSPGYDGEIAKKFASFRRRGVGVGTLVHLAKQHGWQPPERPAPAQRDQPPGCGAQAASHSAPATRPDLASLPEDVRAYIQQIEAERGAALRRAEQLEGQVTTLLAERNGERAEHRLRMQVIRNETLKPAVRLAVLGLASELTYAAGRGKAAADGSVGLFMPALAKASGLSDRSIGSQVQETAALGLVEREAILHRERKALPDGREQSVLRTEVRITPMGGSVAAMLHQAATMTAPLRNHGGARPTASPPRRPWRCPEHPAAPHVATCTICGTIGDERESGAAEPEDLAGCGAQDASHSDGADTATPSMRPPVEVPSVKHAQDALHGAAPPRSGDWTGARERRQPEDASPPRWQAVGICLDCGSTLPAGRKYRCPACTPPVAAPAPPEAGP